MIMKYIKQFQRLILLFSMAFMWSSCGQEAKTTKEETKTASQTIKKGASPIEKIRALNKETEALKTRQPKTAKEFENWLPESVLGMHKISGGALTQDGITGVNAKYLEEHPEYGKDYGKNISILIIDGHGEKGAMAVASFAAIKLENINSEESGGYTKTVNYEDTIVKEEFDKSNKTYTLSFFYNNRFGVEMKAKGIEQNKLWDVFKAFKLDNLTK